MKVLNKISDTKRIVKEYKEDESELEEVSLDDDKINLLSKEQLAKILIEKTRNLEELNKTLKEKNTSLVETQKALSESKAQIEGTFRQLSTVLNTVNDGIITADINGKIVLVNSAIHSMFGYSEDELIGEDIKIIMPTKYHGGHHERLRKHKKGNKPQVLNKTVDLVALRKDGSAFPVEINVSKAIVDGEILFTAAIKDITIRKKMEDDLRRSNELLEEKVAQRTIELSTAQNQLKEMIEELERSNKELEEFAYITSHDLQEPLRMISSFLQILNKKYSTDLDDNAKSYIDFAVEGAGRMKDLIRALLEYSRVGKTATFKAIKTKDLEQLQLNLYQQRLKSINGKLSFYGTDEIVADRMMITQLLQNLIGNAIKFRQKKVPIEISVNIEDKGENWLFSIKDNGIGIKDKFKEKIFFIFQRLHHQDEYEGTGIGLAICKKIVDAHKGKIWIESEVGKGTTFYFTIGKEI